MWEWSRAIVSLCEPGQEVLLESMELGSFGSCYQVAEAMS